MRALAQTHLHALGSTEPSKSTVRSVSLDGFSVEVIEAYCITVKDFNLSYHSKETRLFSQSIYTPSMVT